MIISNRFFLKTTRISPEIIKGAENYTKASGSSIITNF